MHSLRGSTHMTDCHLKQGLVRKQYLNFVRSGELESDEDQMEIVDKLDQLNILLDDISGGTGKKIFRLLPWIGKKKDSIIRGLYIWGPVGRGKTMLMDLFFDHCGIEKKRRTHFHEFMTDAHELIHQHRQALKRGQVNEDDPIPPVAKKISAEAHLLCFDEFSVTDIADAMILSRLFKQLFDRGVVVVATSNVKPTELYKDGLNRSLFLPFVALLEKHVEVLSLEARTDYRLEKLGGNEVYLTPVTCETRKQMNSLWYKYTGSIEGESVQLKVKGRIIEVPVTASGVARFSFDELCRLPNGAAEYIRIANSFHTIFIDDIPVLQQSERNEAKRFIKLIDTLYDHRIKLVASAQSPPEGIYLGKVGNELVEFQRTVSRLVEMQSDEYANELTGSGGIVKQT